MQEEVDEKTVALAVSTTKMTAQALKNSLEKFLQRIDERNRIHVNEARELDLEKKKARTAAKEAARQQKKIQKTGPYSPGKKSLNKMIADGSKLSNIEITDGNIRSFERVARKYGISYSLKKDKSQNPPRYLVFFRAKDKKVIEAAFREYTGKYLKTERKASIRKRLQKAIERSAHHRERVRTKVKNREAER